MLDLARDTLFVTLAGSQAHGTARASSDVDLRGVCVAPLPLRVSLFSSFAQSDEDLVAALGEQILSRLRAHPTASLGLAVKTESVTYDVSKLLLLCANANPNALEILFADPRDWVYETPLWRRIHDVRHRFLTRKVQHTYLGYALAQLKRIESHRGWLLAPIEKGPTRADFGLPEASTLSRDDQHRIERSIAEKVRSYGLDTMELPKSTRIALDDRLRAFQADVLGVEEEALGESVRALAMRSLSLPSEVVAALESERRYRGAMRRWEAYQSWKADRNEARAELERRHGYDTKHAMHLVRLMRTGLEALTTGELAVRRADAEELVAIREGAMSFDALLAHARSLSAAMAEAAETTSLPADVDKDFVDSLALEIIRARL
jgi:uncharacterized protein